MNKKKRLLQDNHIAQVVFRFWKEKEFDSKSFSSIMEAIKGTEYYSVGMLRALKKIAQNYIDSHSTIVTTSIALSEKEQSLFSKKLSAPVAFEIDSKLIAGAKVKVGWNTFDMSVQSKLARLLR